MIPGVVAANTAVSVASVSLWTPLNLSTVPPVYIDASGSTITESSGVVSLVGNLGLLGENGQFSQTDAAKRPTLISSALNGLPILRFDGADDVLSCATSQALALFRNVPAAWSFIVHKKRGSDASPTLRYLVYSGNNVGATRFGLLSGFSSAGNANKPSMFARRLDAESAASLLSPDAVFGDYCISFMHANFSTRAGVIRKNGEQVASNATLTTSSGNTSDTSSPSNYPLSVGAFSSGASASDADIACVVLGNTNPSAAEVDKLEGWAAHKWGLTGNLPAGHPYKTTAPTV